MRSEAIVAGHGGQGVLELANWLAYYHLANGRHVASTPSYGPETRGGKVRGSVVAADAPIDSPIIETPDLLVVMNTPSLDFVPMLRPGGTLLVNRSLVAEVAPRPGLRVVEVPATDLAAGLFAFAPEPGLDTSMAANAVVFGAILALGAGEWATVRGPVEEVFRHTLTDRKQAYRPLDLRATESGFRWVRDHGAGALPATAPGAPLAASNGGAAPP